MAWETLELLRRTLLPICGIITAGIGTWLMTRDGYSPTHTRRAADPRIMTVVGAVITLIGFLLIALSDLNLAS